VTDVASRDDSKVTVAVLGAGGYAGGELLRLILGHPRLELVLAASRTHKGKPLAAAHPNLEGASDLLFEDSPPLHAAGEADVVFLALAHGDSMKSMRAIAGLLEGPRYLDPRACLVVDLSGDFRLATKEAYERAYDHAHEAPELLGTFVYGCPELAKGEIAGARRISNPGCFATGAALALAPLAKAGLLRGTVVVNGVTGASGSGVTPSAGTHFPGRDGNFKAYKVLSHQHEPEIAQTLARLAAHGTAATEPAGGARAGFDLVFTAHSAPITRGIHTTATVELASESDAASALDLYRSFFEGSRFVRVRDRPVELKGLAGTNKVEIGVASRGRHVVVTSALDNLVKGAAGQAVQNANLALGFPEDAGLGFGGFYP
jgi:N-acetyl-gamma-glutamyl-phosphate reductase